MSREYQATPCPFCGCPTVNVFEYAEDAAEVSCNGCGVQMATTCLSSSHLMPAELALSAWNHRYVEEAVS